MLSIILKPSTDDVERFLAMLGFDSREKLKDLPKFLSTKPFQGISNIKTLRGSAHAPSTSMNGTCKCGWGDFFQKELFIT
jgi:hypothetical protein